MVSAKLKLKFQEILRGDFKTGNLNLLLVFQVNCPGCFLQAFPIANQLKKDYSSRGLNVLGLSTAFEDFELNTLENTKRLMTQGELTGETKRILNRLGHKKLPLKIQFDVAFDFLEPRNLKDIDKEAENYCQQIEGFEEAHQDRKDVIHGQLKQYFFDKKYTAFTFDENKLQGTPSWILFDKNFHVLFECFGNKEYDFFQNLLKSHLTGSRYENPV